MSLPISPEQASKIIEDVTRTTIKEFCFPQVHYEIQGIVSTELHEMIQREVRIQINRPWRWQFKVGRIEVALRLLPRKKK